MVLRRFRRIAKSVAKAAAEELVKRAVEFEERRASRSEESLEQSGAAVDEARSADLPEPPGPPEPPATSQVSPKAKKPKKRSPTKRAKAATSQAPPREPLPTRTMARLLMKQERWARALLIYDQLQGEQAGPDSHVDLALAAERMTAYNALAVEEEAPVTWRHLRQRGDELLLHDPSDHGELSGVQRPLHLAILCFDRSALVQWEVQRDDRVAAGSDFAFAPTQAGDYAVAAVDRDGTLQWVTPICEWDETAAR